MRREILRCVPYIVLGLLAGLCTRSPAAANTFLQHWDNELVRLQGWPAQVERDPTTITFCAERLRTCQMQWHLSAAQALPPMLYLLDRQDAAGFAPGTDHTWAALEVRELSGKDAASCYPNPEQQPAHVAILAAVRALDVLAALQGRRSRRCGVVGEGLGATVALAVAALRPEQVAFVCAHEPVEPATQPARTGLERWARETEQAAEYVAPEEFARLVTAPTLLSLGEADEVTRPERIEAVYAALGGPKELVVIRGGRHCQTADLRQWGVLWRQWADGL